MGPSNLPSGGDDDNSMRRSSSSRGGRIFVGGDPLHMSSSSMSSSSSLSLNNALPPDHDRRQRSFVVSSPRDVLWSMYNDVTARIVIEFVLSLGMFHFGTRGPTSVVLPMLMDGTMTMRDVPYQLTKAGDVLLDLALNNEYVPKSDVIFPCESHPVLPSVLPVFFLNFVIHSLFCFFRHALVS